MKTITHSTPKPVPTGDPWHPNPRDPATVPVPLPVLVAQVEAPYTERDRKLWTLLLHVAWSELEHRDFHEVPVSQLSRLLRHLGSEHDTQWLWASARRLAGPRVTWSSVGGDGRYRGIRRLLRVDLRPARRTQGCLRFGFPPPLIPILKHPKRFARVRTHVQLSLSGKYAVTLYGLLESVVNKEVPVLKAQVEALRQWLHVPTGKLLRWADFHRRVLAPAVWQLNEKAHMTGFIVEIVAEKGCRSTEWVHFEVIKTPEREAFETSLHRGRRWPEASELRLRPQTYETALRAGVGRVQFGAGVASVVNCSGYVASEGSGCGLYRLLSKTRWLWWSAEVDRMNSG